MTSDTRDDVVPSPDEAFDVLGNETRVRILQAFGAAEEPVSFTELRDRLGIRQGGNFNYHLDKLIGHFVTKTDAGYALRPPGRRVVEAILSGAVTETPEVERTAIDQACPYCGAPGIEVSYRAEQLGAYCPQCRGAYGGTNEPSGATLPGSQERIGYLRLPPAGIQDRTPEEMLQAAEVRHLGELMTTVSGVCRDVRPRSRPHWISARITTRLTGCAIGATDDTPSRSAAGVRTVFSRSTPCSGSTSSRRPSSVRS